MKSFDDRIRAVGGFGPGFDGLRIALAFAVMGWHALAIADGNTAAGKAGPAWLFFDALLPMFFALSGFLVTGSALRLPLRQYVLNRVFRIVPALAVDIMLCALILGPIFTALPMFAYFTGDQFRLYFLNIFGFVHYALPGVFIDNPIPAVVNGSLWTVPFEIGCYVVMSLMIRSRVIHSARLTGSVALGWLVLACIIDSSGWQSGSAAIDMAVGFLFSRSGGLLIPCFLGGSALYLARGRIPFDARIAIGFVLLLVAASLLLDGSLWSGRPLGRLLWLVPTIYVIVYIGLHRLPALPLFGRGDYSYGVYLYHFPILQALSNSSVLATGACCSLPAWRRLP
jgi:peptidoglycan/LPS O-acetylase OafA/YrhL